MAEDAAAPPEFYSSGVQVSTDGKDFQIIFLKRVVSMPVPEEPENVMVAAMNMSRGSIADLHASIGTILDQLNEPFGPVSTAYLAERKAGK